MPISEKHFHLCGRESFFIDWVFHFRLYPKGGAAVFFCVNNFRRIYKNYFQLYRNSLSMIAPQNQSEPHAVKHPIREENLLPLDTSVRLYNEILSKIAENELRNNLSESEQRLSDGFKENLKRPEKLFKLREKKFQDVVKKKKTK